MATTRDDIANEALSMIGAERIAGLDDPSPAAREAAFHVDRVRRDLLEDYPWNWAERRARLARRVGVPLFGWSYAYSLPHDWLRTNKVYGSAAAGEDDTIPYSVEVVADEMDVQLNPEGRRALLANDVEVYMTYVGDVSDPNQTTMWFRRAWIAELASRLAYRLSGRPEIEDRCELRAERALLRARARDAAGEPPERLPESSLILARGGGGVW